MPDGPAEERGYRPLDLTGLFNAPRTLLDDGDRYPLGPRTLYGIPFLFGDERAGTALLRVAGEPVTVPVGRAVEWLLFAHALESPDLFDGRPVGGACARYTLVYEDGHEEPIPVRRRFEIGPTPRLWSDRPIPLDWGQTPFLAVPDAEHRLMPRVHGRYDAAGARFVDIDDPQARSPYVLPYRFYLWPCRNPRPGVPVRAVEIRSLGPAVLVGAVTASALAEDPFGRTVWRDVLLDLHGEPVSEDLSVSVDRGSATYVYQRLTGGDDGGTPAWGSPPAPGPHAYVRVAATPSARLTLTRGGTELAACGWGDLVSAGEISGEGVTWRLPDAGRAWVRTVVRDSATGEPVPCRIHFRSADGVPYPPHGHHGHINSDGNTWNLDIGGDVRLGATTYSYIDGTCEGWLPLGEVTVEVARGFEYRPLRTTITVRPGSPAELELTLTRVADLPSDGWYAGDTHVHFVSTLGAELEARGEDVSVTNLLLSQWGHLFTNTEEFTGRPHTSADGHTHVFAGQENRSGMLGHVNLLGLRRPVMPWCTGGAEEAELGGGLETTLSHWADECHEQGGTVVLAHFPVPNGEAAALLATDRLDAVEMIAYDPYNIGEYYRYLNAGYRVTLVGGTDKMSSEVPIGLIRTYAHVPPPGELDYWSWCAAVRDGATFVTSGPLLSLRVDGHEPRAVGSGAVRVEARAESIFPVDRIEIVRDGRVVAEHAPGRPGHALEISADLTVTGDSWIAARCYGPGADVARHHDVWARPIMAHTSPVYLRTGEEYGRFDADTVEHMLSLVEGSMAYIDERSRRMWPGQVCHRHGRDDHLAFLRAPFLEARDLLLRRTAERR
ncbi:CehA/McbA family metallohydrolase [Spongiactinospora sp. TRM90649]|uniref:CehA/McbA family metallohydrolase n=1 Tax=Spongiactinospora sp. TRM90649 TaxID=3031114 RepID=UPI0023F75FA4|nr:CehA/McbA family metallohydrolase [Spongiactinospora sp. TRM90649]MDF5752667.1 CehA/McbA family metallohydrolase [Spongiactinospora sp. TRM90649]